MAEERLVPKLRFSGFSENWESIKIGDCLDVKYGKDYKHLNEGKYPVLGTGGVMEYVDDFLYSGESILIGRKGTIDKPVYIDESFWTVDTLFYTEIKNQFPKFLFYCISNINWLKYNEASGVPSLSANNIKNVKINVPSLIEQKKIANFVTSIDYKIELLEKKHESLVDFKKYLMQQIFAQKLRFADCTDEWKVCKFKDLGTVKSGVGFSNKYQGHLDLDYNVYKVSDMNLKGNEKVMTKSNNTIDDNILNDMGAKLIREPSIIFAKVGEAIFLNRKRIAKPHFLIDNNMMAFSPNNNVDLEFMYYLTTSINFGKYAQTGALPSYNASDIYSIKCKIPPLEEQKRIGNLLSLADNKINNCSNQINNVLNFKRGLLQQMFV